jgi:hypothetical protein
MVDLFRAVCDIKVICFNDPGVAGVDTHCDDNKPNKHIHDNHVHVEVKP